MANVELIITADGTKVVKTLREISEETEKNFRYIEKTQKEKKGLIEKEEAVLKKLQEWKKKATTETIELYNKEIDNSKSRLQAYETVGTKANQNIEKSGKSLMASLKGWAAGFLTVKLAVDGFKKVMESTDSLSQKFKVTLAGWKSGFDAMFRAIANKEFKDFFKNVKDAVTEGQRYAEMEERIEDSGRAMEMQIEENETAILHLREAQNDATKSETERIAKGKEAEEKIKENAKLRVDLAEMFYENDIKNAEFVTKQIPEIIKAYLAQDEVILKNVESGMKWLNLQIEYDKLGGKGKRAKAIWEEVQAMTAQDKENYVLAKGLNKLIDTQKDKIVGDYKAIESAKQTAINLRVSSRLDALTAKDQKKTDDERIKAKENFFRMLTGLQEDYDQQNIKSLEGADKLFAERTFALKQLEIRKKQMKELGTLTPEIEELFRKMGEQVQAAFIEGMLEEQPTKIATEDLLGNFVESLSEGIQKSTTEFKPQEEITSLWQLVGIDPESDKGREQIAAIEEGADIIMGTIDEIYAKRVEDAQRNTDLLNNRLSEVQRELEGEMSLMEAGFANNVTAKRKELEDLKKQREQALADEEAAIKKQRALEQVSQTISLISSVANILKAFTKLGPVGLVLAAVAIGTLYSLFANAKTKAIASTKLAEGGYGDETGVITGRSHHAGGERFLDHIEVERDEAFGVLSRRATDKYGDMFQNIVSSFNKDEMPQFTAPTVSNSINVENSGPNSRLDKVINEQKKLNESILKQTQHYNVGNKRVIKSGNKIRIIG